MRNATDAWSLRCEHKEDFVGLIWHKYPDALTKTRHMDAEEV
jgi:hypothetical protein